MCNNVDELEDIKLDEESQSKRTGVEWFHLHVSNSKNHTESRMVVVKGWREGEVESANLQFTKFGYAR